MVGETNVSGAGRLRAVIAVTYPEGSICTCSNGTKTLRARGTSGKALFNVTVGEWTVSCTDGSQTTSNTVSITSNGQYESVALYYTLYLYNQGDLCEDVTGGWEATGEAGAVIGGTVSFSDGEMVIVGNNDQARVDASCKSLDSGILARFTKLCVHVTYTSGQILAARIVDNLTNKTTISQVTFSGAGDYNLPLDAISEGQIIMLAYMGTLKVTKIWLE